MPIVSSSILRVINKQNGIAVYEQHTDHLGVIHDHRYRTTTDADKDANLANWAAGLDAIIKRNELDAIEQRVSKGEDPNNIATVYVNGNRKLRAVVRAVMRTEAEKVLNAIDYINAITDTTLDTIFNVAKRNRIRARIAGLESIKTGLESDTSLREEV